MSVPTKACCTLKPVESDYEPVGEIIHLGDLPAYVVGPKDSKKSVIVLYDIFGFHVNTKQFCDVLAKERDYRVIMPDFFRGDYFPEENIPDKDSIFTNAINFGKLIYYFLKHATYGKTRPGLVRAQKWLQEQGVESAGIVGFCWGAKMAIQYSGEEDFIVGSSLIHPSMLNQSDFAKAKAPILLIPTKDEPDLLPLFKKLESKPFADKCKHIRYDDMHHGFCAARGNWADEENKKRATEAIQETINFFDGLIANQ
ncbi:Alpha/Beta hydrolase protein [Gongronella butleri]|nr:Alpha/Beta hydrolase protein [Gongronella butleri]